MSEEDFYQYGWLSPYGDFYQVDWGDHSNFAMAYVAHHKKLNEEFEQNFEMYHDEGQFLYQKGWVLLHNPEYGLAIVTRNELKHLSKKQKEFLFDYYYQRNQIEIAKRYI